MEMQTHGVGCSHTHMWWIKIWEGYLFFLIYFLLLFNYSCMPFLPFPPPTPAEPTSLPHPHHRPRFCPCVLYNSSCNPLFPLSPPHSPLATARQFPPQCLWWYFVCFFLLLIMFQLKVRSYGICPSPPGLFHLA